MLNISQVKGKLSDAMVAHHTSTQAPPTSLCGNETPPTVVLWTVRLNREGYEFESHGS